MAVWTVAQYLSERGNHVRVNAAGAAPEASQWKDYVDVGDLEICLRVEVKKLSANFTGLDDWPFRNEFIVCAKHAYDKATPKPFGFFFLSANNTHAAVVKAATAPSWTVKVRKDSRYEDVEQEFYFCPIQRVSWIQIRPEVNQ